MEGIERIFECVAESGNTLTQLDQSILNKGFRGELVPQDPNDEPASELLSRIHRRREATKVEKVQKGGGNKTATKLDHKTMPPTASMCLLDVLRNAGTRLHVDELQAASGLSSRKFYMQLKDAITSGLIAEVIEKDNRYLVPAK